MTSPFVVGSQPRALVALRAGLLRRRRSRPLPNAWLGQKKRHIWRGVSKALAAVPKWGDWKWPVGVVWHCITIQAAPPTVAPVTISPAGRECLAIS
jgi:hypothetical protein